jgi:hypothetical protein
MMINKLINSLDNISNSMLVLMDEIPLVYKQNKSIPGYTMIAPEFYWELDNTHVLKQMKLLNQYHIFIEVLRIYFQKAPVNLIRKFESANKNIRSSLDFNGENSDKGTTISNFKNKIDELNGFINILNSDSSEEIILVPDTNSLIREADPHKYVTLHGHKFTFLLLPSVLSELDSLKMNFGRPELKEKAKKIIKRIKGWRKQGSLNQGVILHSTITVMTEFKEPNMSKTLSWLDSNTNDDRIIASIINLHIKEPSSRVVLVTGDINLQNKADAAFIEVAELES